MRTTVQYEQGWDQGWIDAKLGYRPKLLTDGDYAEGYYRGYNYYVGSTLQIV